MNYQAVQKKEAFKIFIQYFFGKCLYGILKVNSLELHVKYFKNL